MVDAKTRTDVDVKTEADPSIITVEVFIFDIIAYVLIDLGSTHSHASLKFGTTLPSKKVMYSDMVLRACPITVDDRELFLDSIILDMDGYEIILSMD